MTKDKNRSPYANLNLWEWNPNRDGEGKGGVQRKQHEPGIVLPKVV